MFVRWNRTTANTAHICRQLIFERDNKKHSPIKFSFALLLRFYFIRKVCISFGFYHFLGVYRRRFPLNGRDKHAYHTYTFYIQKADYFDSTAKRSSNERHWTVSVIFLVMSQQVTIQPHKYYSHLLLYCTNDIIWCFACGKISCKYVARTNCNSRNE